MSSYCNIYFEKASGEAMALSDLNDRSLATELNKELFSSKKVASGGNVCHLESGLQQKNFLPRFVQLERRYVV